MLKVQGLLALVLLPVLGCGYSPEPAYLSDAENWRHEGCRHFNERFLPISRDRLHAEIKRLTNYSPNEFSYGEICKDDEGAFFFTIVLKQKGEKHPLANDPAFSIESDGSLILIKQE